MMKILLLCAILAALCGAANAQYLTPDPYRSDEQWLNDWHHDEQMLQQRQDFERQLQQQRDDAQRQLEAERYRSMMDDVGNNFGCDIHNHCR